MKALAIFYSTVLDAYKTGIIARNDAAYCIAQTLNLKGKYAQEIEKITSLASKFDNPDEWVADFVQGDITKNWELLVSMINNLPKS